MDLTGADIDGGGACISKTSLLICGRKRPKERLERLPAFIKTISVMAHILFRRWNNRNTEDPVTKHEVSHQINAGAVSHSLATR